MFCYSVNSFTSRFKSLVKWNGLCTVLHRTIAMFHVHHTLLKSKLDCIGHLSYYFTAFGPLCNFGFSWVKLEINCIKILKTLMDIFILNLFVWSLHSKLVCTPAVMYRVCIHHRKKHRFLYSQSCLKGTIAHQTYNSLNGVLLEIMSLLRQISYFAKSWKF